MRTLGILVIGLALGAFATSAVAQDAAASLMGVFYSHETREEFDLSSIRRPGEHGSQPAHVKQHRSDVSVPDFYGPVIAVTGDNDRVVLWYRDSQDDLRNAVLDNPAARLYRVRKTRTENLRTRKRR